jgi:bifunctional DNase/RNase
MFEKVQYLTHTVYNNIPTHYFYHKESKTLIPVKIENQTVSHLLEPHPSQPQTAETLKKLVFALGVRVQCIKIYLFQDNNFYTYISVKGKEQEVDINMSFSDAIKLALLINSPILFEKTVIKECGFRVTKKMIEKSLLS